jgi:hypothetical protein
MAGHPEVVEVQEFAYPFASFREIASAFADYKISKFAEFYRFAFVD